MLDFDKTRLEDEKRTHATQFRHGESLGALVAEAAAAQGVDKSVFLRQAVAKEATRVLEARSRHVLTAEDAALFAAALDAPPAPTPRAIAAAKAYRRRVVHAD
ncbi:MAG: DUF1778 domain-containing protein [Alphaproteobacteria bacterium]|nr:MAG: DUF1778 domain-containing protein [Alphaproteobacteria bacterium]